MSVNGITNGVAGAYTAPAAANTKTNASAEDTAKKAEDVGVVYEPSDAAKDSKTSKTSDYSSIVKNMKLELSTKNKQLESLVSQLLGKQANKYTSLADMFKNINADPETIAQAQKDISDDGYWGVEQTSDRLVSMAQALSGGDASKADEMIAAIKKGYDQATKAWGDKLPDICQKTIDSATKKLTDWRNSLNDKTAAEDTTVNAAK